MLIGARQILAVCLAFGLAGCFTGETPLIDDEHATAPFAKIFFWIEGDTDLAIAVRLGKTYFVTDGEEEYQLRFKDIGDGLLVTEMTGDSDGKVFRLYAVLRVDVASRRAFAYKARASARDEMTGLRKCESGFICIDDLNAYAALGRAAIAAGEEPADVYVFTLE